MGPTTTMLLDEEPDDGRKREQHDQVIHRNLDKGVRGIAIRQVAPHKHHRCAALLPG